MLFLSALAVTLAARAYAAYLPDEIVSLPGWAGRLPSRQFSGYLNVSSTKLHYWLVESENDPANAATVLWFNGGPGCSSLDGFIYEHGPFVVSKDFQTLTPREYRWNLKVNMLYIEAPVGVGFSYSEINDYKCDDDRTASENLAAVEAFFGMYPEYVHNRFYITGESYAGVYVPTLAEAILNAQNAKTYTGAALSGIAVGNGCSGTEVGICGDGPQGTYYEWQYLLQTAFISTDLKNQVNAACDWAAAALNTKNALSADCVGLLNTASGQVSHVNLYNIYGDCVNDMCAAHEGAKPPTRGKVPARAEYVVDDEGTGTATAGAGTEGTAGAGTGAGTKAGAGTAAGRRRLARIIPQGPDACIDSGLATGYLNRAEVMRAIHVKDPGYCWSVCGTAAGWSYQSTRTNLPRDTYPALTAAYRVTIFNGDWDACVPYTDGEAWTEGMGYPVKNAWHHWTYTSTEGNDNQVAGYATEYDVPGSGGSFQFVTVKGGRHEVPESAPAQAFELLTRMVENKPF